MTSLSWNIDTTKKLQQAYLPSQMAVVRLADEACVRGRSAMRAGNKKVNRSRKVTGVGKWAR